MKSLLVITHSGAGSDDTEDLDAALRVLRAEASVDVAETDGPGELDGVLHRAGESRVIVVAGGDGSMHAVVAALHRRNELAGRNLALLPLGTGNDFARAAGVPEDPAEAARAVLDGEARAMSLLVDEFGDVVVNNVHIGAGAQASRIGHVAKSALRKVKLGKLGYPIGAIMAAIKPHVIRVKVVADGEVVNDLTQPIAQLALGNGSDVGGGTSLNPEADPESDTIDVVISRSTGPIARFAYAARLAAGDHHERDDVVHLKARQVAVSGEAFWCSADGQLSGPERRRTWRIEPGAYRLILPA